MYDRFVDAVARKVDEIRVGQPLDIASGMGPVVSHEQYRKVLDFVEAGTREGARLVAGGGRPTGDAFKKGYRLRPTVFADVSLEMRIARSEIFGPVLSIFRWKALDETVEAMNSVDYGLTAAVWTNDLSLALKTANRIKSGHIWINGVSNRFRGVPYGGFKNSGLGRDSGSEELVSYMEEKSINVMI